MWQAASPREAAGLAGAAIGKADGKPHRIAAKIAP
jgi:hypothetical protein